jgi:hypothetical protein
LQNLKSRVPGGKNKPSLQPFGGYYIVCITNSAITRKRFPGGEGIEEARRAISRWTRSSTEMSEAWRVLTGENGEKSRFHWAKW